MSKLVIDLETTGIKEYGRQCNPLNPKHEVNVYSEYRGPGTEPKIITDFDDDLRPYLDLNLDGVTHIIGHNLKFDLLFLWGMPQLQEWLKNGGKIWDTMLAEYYLRGHLPSDAIMYKKMKKTDTPISELEDFRKKRLLDLGSLAFKYLGEDKEDGIKELWDQGLTTKEIGKLYPEKFLRYADKDVVQPWKICAKQVKHLKKEGRLTGAEIYMEHLLGVIEMEYNGVCVNTELGYEKARETQHKVDELLQKMQELVKTKIDERITWTPTDRLVSAVLFGGTIPVSIQVPNPTKTGVTHYQSGAKKGQLRTKKGVENVEVVGYNLPTKYTHQNKNGWYQVDNKTLRKLMSEYSEAEEFIELLLEYRKLNKVLDTYYITDPYNRTEKVKKGLLTLIHDSDKLLHPEFNIANTVTGRMSSKNPNGQNLNKPVQELIQSRFEDGVVIEADFSNLEVITKGAQSGCKNLIQDYIDGLDTHCLNTAMALDKPYEEIYEAYKTGDKEITELRRRIGKVITFEGEYGKLPEDIARDNGLDPKAVEKVFLAKQERYAEVFELEDNIQEDIKDSRRPDIGLLRIKKSKKYVDDLPSGYYNVTSADAFNVRNNEERAGVGFYRNPFGQMWRYEEMGVLTTRNSTFRYFRGPNMKNYYNQGFAALVMKIATGRIFREYAIYHRDTMRIMLEVHDAIVVDSTKEMSQTHMAKIKEIMESTAEHINRLYKTNLCFPVRADISCGRTWLAAKEAS